MKDNFILKEQPFIILINKIKRHRTIDPLYKTNQIEDKIFVS